MHPENNKSAGRIKQVTIVSAGIHLQLLSPRFLAQFLKPSIEGASLLVLRGNVNPTPDETVNPMALCSTQQHGISALQQKAKRVATNMGCPALTVADRITQGLCPKATK